MDGCKSPSDCSDLLRARRLADALGVRAGSHNTSGPAAATVVRNRQYPGCQAARVSTSLLVSRWVAATANGPPVHQSSSACAAATTWAASGESRSRAFRCSRQA